MDINEIDKETDSELDALEQSWFAAYRAAEAARADLQTAQTSGSDASALAGLLVRLDNAERQKHEIMQRIHALEDRLID